MTGTADFSTITIIGIGLIGSSMARAIRAKKLATKLIGFDRDTACTQKALALGLVDDSPATLKEAVKDADLIIIATPVGATLSVCRDIASLIKPGCIVTDVGSVKGNVLDAAAILDNKGLFVPAHPVAGTEQSGPEAGFAELFSDRWVILTPVSADDHQQYANNKDYAQAIQKVADLWRAIGARVEIMDARHHDLALAITSHLPHLIAFTLVGAADDLESVNEAEIIKYSAGGFRDFTRIAASDPVMWRDVFLNNKDAVLEVLGRFTEELALLQRAIRWEDGDKLTEVFTRGRTLRRAIVEAGQETDEPNFGRDR